MDTVHPLTLSFCLAAKISVVCVLDSLIIRFGYGFTPLPPQPPITRARVVQVILKLGVNSCFIFFGEALLLCVVSVAKVVTLAGRLDCEWVRWARGPNGRKRTLQFGGMGAFIAIPDQFARASTHLAVGGELAPGYVEEVVVGDLLK